MNSKWRDSIFFKIIDEYIISPVGWFSEEYGKIIISISTICICLFVSRPMTRIELPREAKDTVGEIPIINHYDDGKLDNDFYLPYPQYYPSCGGISGNCIMTTGLVVWQ